MALPVGQFVKKLNTETGFSNFSVGDTVIVKNTDDNDGIYTVNAITTDGSHSYMGLTGPPITQELDQTDVDIIPVGTTGDKLVALGDEDSGTVNIWSYNGSTNSSTGTVIESGTPGVEVGTSGWTANAISPVMSGSNAEFVFTAGQGSLRVCDSNDTNTSLIKHYKFYETVQFNSSGSFASTHGTGSFLGWQESINTLPKPSSGGLLTIGSSSAGGFSNDNWYLDGIVLGGADDTKFYGFSDTTTTAGERQKVNTDYHLVRSLNNILSSTTGVYETDPQGACQIKSDANKNPTATQTYIEVRNSSISKIPIGAVIGLSNTNGRIDSGVTFYAERMVVRNLDIENNRMYVYRGYGTTNPTTIDTDAYPNIVQYGCGFNFTVQYDTDGEGYLGYESGDYEFAQSFIYDGDQESLLRTKKDYVNTDTIKKFTIPQNNEGMRLRIRVAAFGPYPARVTGGRIYIKKIGDENWSLLVDIDLAKGGRTSLTGDYVTWRKVTGTETDGDATDADQIWASGVVPNDCFYLGEIQSHPVPGGGDVSKNLISEEVSPYKYEDINNYYPDMIRNSIGHLGESYKCSTVGGERAWYGNVKLRENSSGSLTRFGDRVMYSEYRKYDVIPGFNYINVSEGDSDDIVQIKFFTNKLFVFKSNSVHIWNVAQPEPINWFPEQTMKNNGLQHPASAIDTPYGIVWANRSGCFYYDGKNVTDLTEQKIKDTENSYHGATLPPSWESFIQSAVYTVNPLIMFAPKEKQIYIMKDPTKGGSTEDICYIYNFMTKSWTYNDSIFTDGVAYTNPIKDWNDNVVIAHEGYVDTGLNLGTDFPDFDVDVITDTKNIRFNSGSQDWTEYSPDGVAPAFSHSTANDRLELDHTNNNGNKEGAQLALNKLTSAAIIASSFYRVTINLQHAGSAGDNIENIVFKLNFFSNIVDIGTITNVSTEYTLDVECSSASADPCIMIYHDGSDGTGTAVETAWYINEVSIKNITLDLNASAANNIQVGDRLVAADSSDDSVPEVGDGNEEFFVKNVISDKVVVEPGYNSTSSIAHSSSRSIYAYKAAFKQLSPTSVATAAPSFITKDYDFDDPSRVKKIYKIYITYMNSAGSQLDNLIKVAADGNTTFAQTSISTPHSASTYALTGSFLASQSKWNVAVFSFDNPFPCQSIALYFNDGGTANGVSINDISFEYRTIHKRVS
tara:strand:- start:2535 stop:6095 length:3561 start_codon:yes stop_codon:yes gene_type:complete